MDMPNLLTNFSNGSSLPYAPAEDASVKNARNRFKNVLKHMVQDSFLPEDDPDSSGYRRYLKKRDKLLDPPKPQASFVMKLFDRGVDLAQFDDSTPLYPICRAWMQNKPHNPRATSRKNDDNDSEISEMEVPEDTDEIHRLPPPEPLPVDEYGNQIRMRIPPPLDRESTEPFELDYDDETAPSPALLFQNHLDRWNLVRQRWREASAYNERRYDSSFALLRQIHDRFSRMAAQENADSESPKKVSETGEEVEEPDQ